MFTFTPFALPWAIVALALFVLAGVIYARQRASRVAVLFCATIALVGIWFSGFAVMFSATHPQTAAHAARIALAAICFLPAVIYDFTATALRMRSSRVWLIRAAWIIAAVFAGVTLFTDGMMGGMSSHPWGFYPTRGAATVPFLLYFAGALGTQLVDGITEWRRTTDDQRRRRVAKLMISFIVVYFAALDWLPMFGVAMRPMSWLPVLAFMAVAWGTIRRHRFLPITAARASREILDTMADALFVLDASGCIRVTNHTVRELLGYGDSDLLGRSIDRLEVVTGDATISRTLTDLAHRGAIREQERVLRHKDGHGIDVSLSISPVGDTDEQEGAVVIARDIRARKRAEEVLRNAMSRLEQSNRELEDFAYVASHDLQEPLRKIQAFGDLLRSKHAAEMDAQARDYVERMQSAANRMQVLINDLLSFSRVTTNAQPFVRVDLGAVASEVVKDLEARIVESGGRITVGPMPVIDADPLQMRQLLQNLAANALKFRRDDVPPVVDVHGELENGRCRITVVDNGIGFEEKYAERIFTMFERLHARTKYEGTGIGLAICRKIAERHGGEIRAHGKPGEGATFVVTLPATHEGNDER
ncbi:MAG TPA: ATP-binding protein [Thermoanaerobaculia bacterium]|jgi:two-component system sensor kinase FixL|nr:ATP-binding protein [Thermoanaerobaculia bacterium]